MPNRTPGSRRAGFTLIELLVVIAIIAILAAILFPVFAQAREKARQTACLSNQKQIGNAMMMYAQDWDESLPLWDSGLLATPRVVGEPQNSWHAKLMPYVKSGDPERRDQTGVWRCPSLGAQGEADTPSSQSYGMSNLLVIENPDRSTIGTAFGSPLTYRAEINLPMMDAPASVVYVGETGNRFRLASPLGFQTASLTANYTRSIGGSWNTLGNAWEVPTRHSGGSNYVFADGHAKWFKREAMFPAPNNAASRKEAARIISENWAPFADMRAAYRTAAGL